jgi:hypothetical protein
MSSLKKSTSRIVIAVSTVLSTLVLLYLVFSYSSIFLDAKQSDLYSNNWSGYAAFSSSSASAFDSISASWTVPKVASLPAPGYSSAWIGIGGLLDSESNRLIQVGTEHDVQSGGSTNYYAWFEVLPRPAVNLGAVLPGDIINARINRLDDTQSTWHVTLSRESHENRITLIDNDVVIRTDSASTRSAEFIMEAPTIVSHAASKLLPVANFDTIAFSHCTTNLGDLGSLKNLYRLTMTSDGTKDGTLLASTSAISKISGDDGFKVKRLG